MRILFITSTIPFPPQNGVELPVAQLSQYLARKHSVDFLICSSETMDVHGGRDCMPPEIGDCYFLNITRPAALVRYRDEFFRNIPVFMNWIAQKEDLESVLQNKHYDWVWISPLSPLFILDLAIHVKLNFYSLLAIGLNDILTAEFKDALQKFVKRGSFEFFFLARALRQWSIKKFEANLLERADLLHVQSSYEIEKARSLFENHFNQNESKFLSSSNGTNVRYLSLPYYGLSSGYLLFVTPLRGPRRHESYWFLKNVWPEIRNSSDLDLWIVGKSPLEKSKYLNDDRIFVKGFVSNIEQCYQNAAMAILPIFHRAGLVNRLQDALCIGVPMVVTKEIASTMSDLKHNENIIVASGKADFAKKVLDVYSNKILRTKLSEAAKELMKSKPTWEDFGQEIEVELMAKMFEKNNIGR